MAEAPLAKVSNDEARNELRRVLESPLFDASERNRRFLVHVVEETLAGRADRIKAYSIATQVFGRGEDFDPLQDSIVRIEAARLRRALEHFYLLDEQHPRFCISIPKGAYIPEFIATTSTKQTVKGINPPRPVPETHRLGPRILVQKIEQEDGCAHTLAIGKKLTRQVIAALTRFTDLFVYGFETTEIINDSTAAEENSLRLPSDYTLSGTATISKTELDVELLLMKADGRFVWAYEARHPLSEDFGPAELVGLSADIAGQVARILAERDGILDSQAREFAGETAQHFSDYQKVLDFQDYWRTLDPDLFEPLRRDLEKTIARDPSFAAAYACLSMLYSNAARYGYRLSIDCPQPLDRALELARKAIRLAPNSSRAYHARAIAEWFSGMRDESLASLKNAQALNPNDSELLAELGLRLAMRMDWLLAVPLIEEAYERNPLQTGVYRMGLFFYHFAEGRFENALHEAAAIGTPSVAQVHLAQAAALNRLHRTFEAREHLREAERIAPGIQARLGADLVFRQMHPDLIAAIVDALGRTGPSALAPKAG